MPTLSAVIRAYNEGAHLPALLEGFQQQTVEVDQLILVDSGSSDDTVEIAKRYGIDDIVPIAQRDFSFGRALNYGFEVATGDLVLIPSAHVRPVYDTWVEHLIRPHVEDERVGVSYGRQVGDERTKFSEEQVLERWFPQESIPRQDHPFSNNANACVRRDLWVAHRYDEQLTGLEDLDFAKRIMEDGYYVSYVAEAPVIHVHEEDWNRLVNRYRREAIAHKRIFEEQEMPAHEAVMLWARSIVSDLTQAVREGVVVDKAREIVMFRTAQFLGTWEGFRQSGPVTRSLKQRFYYPDSPEHLKQTTPPGRRIDYGS